MMVEVWTRKREMGDGDENGMENTSGYEKPGVQHAWLGIEDLASVWLPNRSGVLPAVSSMGNWLAHEILLSPSFSSSFPPSPLICVFFVLNSTIT